MDEDFRLIFSQRIGAFRIPTMLLVNEGDGGISAFKSPVASVEPWQTEIVHRMIGRWMEKQGA